MAIVTLHAIRGPLNGRGGSSPHPRAQTARSGVRATGWHPHEQADPDTVIALLRRMRAQFYDAHRPTDDTL